MFLASSGKRGTSIPYSQPIYRARKQNQHFYSGTRRTLLEQQNQRVNRTRDRGVIIKKQLCTCSSMNRKGAAVNKKRSKFEQGSRSGSS